MPAERQRAILDQLLSGTLSPEQSEAYSRELANSAWFSELSSKIAREEELSETVRTEFMGNTSIPDEQLRTLVTRLRNLNQAQDESDRTMIQGPPTDSRAPLSSPSRLSSLLSPPPPSSSSPSIRPSKYEFLLPSEASDELGRLHGYRILQVLGEGGMGVVFMAEDLHLKRKLAIKVMRPEIAAIEVHRLRFMREAQTVAQLDHDNIIPIYNVGEENGVPYITMPLLKGESLEDRLKNKPSMSMRELIRYGRQMAQGLLAAHELGVIHRDMKPANIWIETPKDRVRILDFGLARNTFEDIHLTLSGAVMGTPAYMAPEQTKGLKVDHRADLYSLGVVIYQICTGTKQYKGSQLITLLQSLAADKPPSARAINPDVPEKLDRLIAQLLQKDPDKRPHSAEEIVAGLRSLEQSPTQQVEAVTDQPRSAIEFKPAPKSLAPEESKPKSKLGLILGIIGGIIVLAVVAILAMK